MLPTARYHGHRASIVRNFLSGGVSCGTVRTRSRWMLVLTAASFPKIVSESPDPLAVQLEVEYPNFVLWCIDSRELSEELFFQIQGSLLTENAVDCVQLEQLLREVEGEDLLARGVKADRPTSARGKSPKVYLNLPGKRKRIQIESWSGRQKHRD